MDDLRETLAELRPDTRVNSVQEAPRQSLPRLNGIEKITHRTVVFRDKLPHDPAAIRADICGSREA